MRRTTIQAAEALLKGFDERYSDSIFDIEAPELEANVLLAEGDATAAQRALLTVADECPGLAQLRAD